MSMYMHLELASDGHVDEVPDDAIHHDLRQLVNLHVPSFHNGMIYKSAAFRVGICDGTAFTTYRLPLYITGAV